MAPATKPHDAQDANGSLIAMARRVSQNMRFTAPNPKKEMWANRYSLRLRLPNPPSQRSSWNFSPRAAPEKKPSSTHVQATTRLIPLTMAGAASKGMSEFACTLQGVTG